MHLFRLLLCLLLTYPGFAGQLHAGQFHAGHHQDTLQDYRFYHQQIAGAQEAIVNRQYDQALTRYETVFSRYSFSFLRDYQVATQLALQTGQRDKAFTYLRKGIAGGWTWKSVTRNAFLKPLTADPQWKQLRDDYPALRAAYTAKLNLPVREKVRKMFGKDQRKALGALLTVGPKAQERYAIKRFAPHSQRQLAALRNIMLTVGYPGEQRIGTDLWASVILSHHNSISQAHAQQDTLYSALKPYLWQAVMSGQMSPYAYAKIDEWYVAIKSGHTGKHTAFLADKLTSQELNEANQLRQALGLSTVETINGLLDLQQQTGMKFYLPLHFFTRTRITD
nr:hypothetical protein [uncultured Arsenicibacter sp.]